MSVTRDVAKDAIGRHGKVPGGNGYFYGQVVAIDLSGDYLKFRRARAVNFADKWYHRDVVELHPIDSATPVPSKAKT